MEDWLARQQLVIGQDACDRLKKSTIAVIGLGGVGSACVEALCRCGVGRLILVDHDKVDVTNINRQLIALRSTVGLKKTEVCKERVKDINPECEVITLDVFYNENTSSEIFALNPDYVVDCIDTVSSKIHLAITCKEKKIPFLMCLGTGNRFDPSLFKIGDIKETAQNGVGCGLARAVRHELNKNKIDSQTVLYSMEPAIKCVISDSKTGKNAPGSISFCPPVAGYMLAGKVIRDLIGK